MFWVGKVCVDTISTHLTPDLSFSGSRTSPILGLEDWGLGHEKGKVVRSGRGGNSLIIYLNHLPETNGTVASDTGALYYRNVFRLATHNLRLSPGRSHSHSCSPLTSPGTDLELEGVLPPRPDHPHPV